MVRTSRSADVCIVGSGLTGLLLGAGLTRQGMKVTCVESSVPQPPETGCAGILPVLPFLRQTEAVHGLQAARNYAYALLEPMSELADKPPAYMQRRAAYLYSTTEAELPVLKQRQALLSRLGLPGSIAPDAGGCPFPVELSLTATDHILVDIPRWMAALRRSILRGGGQFLTGGRIGSTQQTVFTRDMPPGYSSPLLLERRMLVHGMLTGGPPLHSIQLPVQNGLMLLPCRNGIQVLWDAGRFGMQDQQRALEQFPALLSRHMPDWQQGILQHSWMLLTADGLPLIGKHPGSDHLFAAGEAGVLGAMHAASVLMRHILGQPLPEDRCFIPDRTLPPAVLRAQRHMLRRIYTRNLLRPNAPACSQCGCRMRYSTTVAWWECPRCCSAFDMFGQVMLGPASRTASISIRQRPDL